MLEQLSVITHGGVVVFQNPPGNTKRRGVIDTVIRDYLLEDRVGDLECVLDDIKVKWKVHNTPDLVVMALYPRTRSLVHVERFLESVRDAFVTEWSKELASMDYASINFQSTFEPLRLAFEESEKRQVVVGGAQPFASSSLSSVTAAGSDVAAGKGVNDAPPSGVTSPGKGTAATGSGLVTKDGRTLSRRGEQPQSQKVAAAPAAVPSKKRTKQATVWDTNGAPVGESAGASAAGSSSSAPPTEAEIAAQTAMQRKTYIKIAADGSVAPVQERVWENQKRGRLATWLRSYVGARELDEQDFAAVIPNLRDKLITKNVAVEVAEDVCRSVETSVKGRKLGTFESLHGAIEESMIEALRRILQPKVEINILRSVASAVARKRPYSIVFCGVNGVGKSTSLSKIAYWLQQNGHSILIAAGDTFRHGAVEQLEVHGRCLGVPIFQMGYGTDPSAVAGAAIAQAARQKTDVVLIDTAGRMQDHESRMRALAKLIHDNQPDLVLFVGEALVGNNGVDQLRKFNQCLFDFTPVGMRPRGIDGIVLTKFDTIDDKVGAALTMVYELGQPIVFVGVGQTYQDLKVIEADVVVSALMQ